MQALLLSARGSDCSTARTAASGAQETCAHSAWVSLVIADTSGFDETMNGLSGMNHVLKTQLSELKSYVPVDRCDTWSEGFLLYSYLSETNKRLEFLETGTLPSNRSSFRSHRCVDYWCMQFII